MEHNTTPPPPNHLYLPVQPDTLALPEVGVPSGEVRHEADPFDAIIAGLEPVHDQVQYEFDLIDRFSEKYGDKGAMLLGGLLTSIKSYAGINVPEFQISNPDFGDPNIDENGFLKLKGELAPFHKELINTAAQQPTEPAAFMSSEQSAIDSLTRDGTAIVGDLPERTKELIAEIYHLTGAQVVRDDRANGEKEGVVIRKGKYLGTDVFFEENYILDHESVGGQDFFWFKTLSKDSAELAIADLSESEYREFFDGTGFRDRTAVLEMIQSGELTRENHQAVIASFRSLNQDS